MADVDPLEIEFKYYLENQDELVEQYDGRYLVIKGCRVLGDYEFDLEAVEQTAEYEETGTFLVQRCSPGTGDYIHRFWARS